MSLFIHKSAVGYSVFSFIIIPGFSQRPYRKAYAKWGEGPDRGLGGGQKGLGGDLESVLQVLKWLAKAKRDLGNL